jgi:hypothetical protein
MKNRVRHEGGKGCGEGSTITAPEKLAAIRSVLDGEGPILVEHWFYRAGRGPRQLVFDEFEPFVAYLREKTRPGDAIDVWSIWRICTPQSRIAEGKCPDEDGQVPAGGAY